MSDETDKLYGAALIVDKQLRIIKDRYGLFEELKAERDKLSDKLAKAIDARGKLIDELARELKITRDRCSDYKQAQEDLNVQVRFWRQAAEHAVLGWNALEDKYEALQNAARDMLECGSVQNWHALDELVDEREDPPAICKPVEDPEPGLHIVENEKVR